MLTKWNAQRIQRMLEKDSIQLQQNEAALAEAIRFATTTIAVQSEPKVNTATTNQTTMKDILDLVLTHMLIDDTPNPTVEASDTYQNLSPGQQQALARWLRLSSTWENLIFKANKARLPSLPLILLVQERMAHIIATEIAGHVSPCAVKSESTLSVTLESMDDVLVKWLIPMGPVQEAFRVVAFEALVVVGEHRLLTQGADAVFALKPFEVLEIFSPLLAAMADAGTMEGWLARTEKLARIYFPRAGQA